MPRWGLRYGSWWAVQWSTDSLGLGIHVEPRIRRTNAGVRYGPYVDLHLPMLVISFGRNPIYAGEVDVVQSYSRGGVRG